MAQRNGPSRGTKAVAEVAGGVISRCRVAWSARLDKSSNPTIVPRQSLSGPRIACFSHPFSGALSKGNPAWLASGGVFHCPNFKSRVSELGQHRKLGTGCVNATCACRKSNPNILVVQPAQDRAAKNGPG